VRTRFDQLAKELTAEVFDRSAIKSEKQAPVAADPQFVDYLYEPDPDKLDLLRPFGLLERIAREGYALFEFFHEAPSTDDVLFCMHKQIELRRKRSKGVEPPRLWVMAAGRPNTVLHGLGFERDLPWPTGVHRCAPDFRVAVIVISELPTTRDTLLLRLLGKGPVLEAALAEMMALPEGAPERELSLPIVLRLRPVTLDAAETREDREFFMSTHNIVEEFRAAARQQGIQQGVQQGIQQGVQQGIQQGVQQGIQQTLLKQLRLRFNSVPPNAEQRVLQASMEEVDRWTERVLFAQSLDEVFQTPDAE